MASESVDVNTETRLFSTLCLAEDVGNSTRSSTAEYSPVTTVLRRCSTYGGPSSSEVGWAPPILQSSEPALEQAKPAQQGLGLQGERLEREQDGQFGEKDPHVVPTMFSCSSPTLVRMLIRPEDRLVFPEPSTGPLSLRRTAAAWTATPSLKSSLCGPFSVGKLHAPGTRTLNQALGSTASRADPLPPLLSPLSRRYGRSVASFVALGLAAQLTSVGRQRTRRVFSRRPSPVARPSVARLPGLAKTDVPSPSLDLTHEVPRPSGVKHHQPTNCPSKQPSHGRCVL